jgi:hypothetical protein
MAARWWLAFLPAGRLLTFLDAVPARGYCENGSLAWPGGGPVPGGTSRRCSDACGLPRAEVGLRPRDDVGSRQPVVAPLPVLA